MKGSRKRMNKLTAIIVASGDETRMCSRKSKYTHDICGKSMINWVIKTVKQADISESILFLGENFQEIMDSVNEKILFIQDIANYLGDDEGTIVIVPGNMPLLRANTLKDIIENHTENKNIVTIVESYCCKTVATDNLKIYCFSKKHLHEVIVAIDPKKKPDKQLFDAAETLADKGFKVGTINLKDEQETLKVDDRLQLNEVQYVMKRRISDKLMKEGVSIIDSEATYIDDEVKIGLDTVVLPGCIIKGKTLIGRNCTIGPNSKIINSVINDSVEINNSEIEQSEIDSGTHIGPYAHLRPNSFIGKEVKIGNFVEIKNSTIGDMTKISHLTYVGDSDVGKNVNIGCGVVFVNYNGVDKNRSIVGNNAFIGCNVNLIAPVTISDNTYIAAGSTITDDVPENALAIARERQILKENWVTEKKLKKE